ncbi:transposase [Streptomyces tricolor]|nr:transposase [Streptomyces tricolor]
MTLLHEPAPRACTDGHRRKARHTPGCGRSPKRSSAACHGPTSADGPSCTSRHCFGHRARSRYGGWRNPSPTPPTASQAMHQFVNASPWDWLAARQGLLRWVEQQGGPAVTAWTLAPAFIPKRGRHSAGVHRRFDPLLGRVSNCQLGMVMLATGAHGPLPVDWSLYIPTDGRRTPRCAPRCGCPTTPAGPVVRPRNSCAAPCRGPPAGRPRHRGPVLDARPRGPSRLPGTQRAALPGRSPRHRARQACDITAGRPAGAHRPAAAHRPRDRGRRQNASTCCPSRWPLPGAPAGRARLRLLAQRRPDGSARTWLTNLLNRPLPDLLPLMRQPRQAATVVTTLSGDFGLRTSKAGPSPAGTTTPPWSPPPSPTPRSAPAPREPTTRLGVSRRLCSWRGLKTPGRIFPAGRAPAPPRPAAGSPARRPVRSAGAHRPHVLRRGWAAKPPSAACQTSGDVGSHPDTPGLGTPRLVRGSLLPRA